MPGITWDEYSLSDGQLQIPEVLVGPTAYTNVVLNLELGDVVSVGASKSVLHVLGGSGDGAQPYDSLVQVSDGNFYGMTPVGGTSNHMHGDQGDSGRQRISNIFVRRKRWRRRVSVWQIDPDERREPLQPDRGRRAHTATVRCSRSHCLATANR